MAERMELIGQKFGRLLVISDAGSKDNKSMWNCLCDCGNTKIVFGICLSSGNTKSCGCLLIESRTTATLTHGQGRKGKCTPEFLAWCGLRARCLVDNEEHKNYFGRGIKVCDRWLESFENFFEDMGKRPGRGYSVDREDNDGDYDPSNCRWATRVIQNRNQRSNRIFSYNGLTMYLADWCKYFGVCDSTLSVMVKKWDFPTLYEFYLKKNGTLPVIDRKGRGGLSLKRTINVPQETVSH